MKKFLAVMLLFVSAQALASGVYLRSDGILLDDGFSGKFIAKLDYNGAHEGPLFCKENGDVVIEGHDEVICTVTQSYGNTDSGLIMSNGMGSFFIVYTSTYVNLENFFIDTDSYENVLEVDAFGDLEAPNYSAGDLFHPPLGELQERASGGGKIWVDWTGRVQTEERDYLGDIENFGCEGFLRRMDDGTYRIGTCYETIDISPILKQEEKPEPVQERKTTHWNLKPIKKVPPAEWTEK